MLQLEQLGGDIDLINYQRCAAFIYARAAFVYARAVLFPPVPRTIVIAPQLARFCVTTSRCPSYHLTKVVRIALPLRIVKACPDLVRTCSLVFKGVNIVSISTALTLYNCGSIGMV